MKDNFFRNKRGDIPVTILVLGVFAICALAIFSFLFFNANAKQSFKGVEHVEEAVAKMDAYYFYREVGVQGQEDLTGKSIEVGDFYVSVYYYFEE